jgi:hypothetical protein
MGEPLDQRDGLGYLAEILNIDAGQPFRGFGIVRIQRERFFKITDALFLVPSKDPLDKPYDDEGLWVRSAAGPESEGRSGLEYAEDWESERGNIREDKVVGSLEGSTS